MALHKHSPAQRKRLLAASPALPTQASPTAVAKRPAKALPTQASPTAVKKRRRGLLSVLRPPARAGLPSP